MTGQKFTHPDLDQAMSAIEKVQLVLAFTVDGTITAVNDNYLQLCGYQRDELVGQKLSKLMDPNDKPVKSQEEYWAQLRAGIPQTGEYKRIAKSGQPFWISALYTPVLDEQRQVTQVVVFATDITASTAAASLARRKFDALGRSQAVIEFKPSGEIVTANDNFLDLLGYRLDDIVGKHHSMFMHPQDASSPQYQLFWQSLNAGAFQTGEFRRKRRDGSSIWIVGSYVPVLDESGRVASVVKMATDVTDQKQLMQGLVAGLNAMRGGDLTYRVAAPEKPEFAAVAATFNETNDDLEAMISEIRGRAGQMNDEAVQIARGAGDLARRGESQAASLEETAAAVEEISGNITMTSQSAQSADAAARDALNVVLKGAQVVSEAIAAIERIDEHTKQMGEFTRVIEGFAFQTNLLSINAAVEAARAGEVGRGFAVVANEVRNLAQQSAKASQSIADLIGKSETEVKAGVRLARDAGVSLDQIQTAVSGVVENITGIAHATSEQSTGVREVSTALAQLDGVNQANLSMSEQYAAAAAALSTQVEELGRMMDRFRTQGDVPQAEPQRRVA